MNFFKRNILTFLIVFVFSTAALVGESSFSGFAGGKINLFANKNTEKFDPALSLQSFFSGQFGFSPTTWGHLEFSIDTGDLIESSIFHKTESFFKLDELSITFRQPLDIISNYFSIFMGTYDPIGSDIFLKRQFGINSITSKLTESWLGMAGSLVYPHFGIGISDVIHFSSPTTIGYYLYINHEDANYYVFNGDLRFACAYRYFTFDVAAGVGAPMDNQHNAVDVIIHVESLYWHVGTTMLIGNSYTQGLFLQGGIYNGIFKLSKEKPAVNVKDIYMLVEPRFRSRTMQIHFTAYSLPKGTIDDLLFIHDTLGINFNIFFDRINTQNKSVAFGMHTSLSFPNKYFSNLMKPIALFKEPFNVNITPYITTKLFTGELNAMADVNVMDFTRVAWYKTFSLHVGYKTSF